MNSAPRFEFEFVDHIPDTLQERTLYVSIPFATAVHRCACGCGEEVVTPLTPADWKLIFDGDTVSLDPSIGSWSLPCQSHYWIRRNRLLWAAHWDGDRIEAARRADRIDKEHYYGSINEESPELPVGRQPRPGWLRRFMSRLRRNDW